MARYCLDASLNDKFARAQWKYCPLDLEEEMSRDIHMGFKKKRYDVVHQFLNWNLKDINYIKTTRNDDIIKEMFSEFKTRQSDSCPIVCSNPDVHFAERKCFPIYKVYHVLKNIDENAANHLKNLEFKKRILDNILTEETRSNNVLVDLKVEKVYPIYSIPLGSVDKKEIVLVIDFVIMENFDKESEGVYYTGLNNLLENINQNFTCMLVPEVKRKMDGNWIDFVGNQIDNAKIIVFVLTPLMLNVLMKWRSVTESSAMSSVDFKLEGLRLLWTTAMFSKKPIVGVVFDENLRNDADSLLSVVFYSPNDLKLLLGYLLHRLQNL